MILKNCHKVIFAGLLMLLLASCVETPIPAELPGIKSLSSTFDDGVICLCAELDGETKLILECGFLFGKDFSSTEKYSAVINGRQFSVTIPEVESNTRYVYSAYIGNGRNVIYSQLESLLTPSQPDTGTPGQGDSGNHDGSEEPENPDQDVETSDEIRYELKISYLETLLSFYHAYPGSDTYSQNYAEYSCVFSENTTMLPQEWRMWLTEDNDVYQVRIVQYSYLDLIEFEDPVVKNICVRLADLNGDGEVSFEEAAVLPGMKKEDFAGERITSFHEFQYFASLISYASKCGYLFEGSSLRAITVRDGLTKLGKGMFKDCANLETANIGLLIVHDETFMNCTSLKNIHARVVGERAYMGCTALETASQLCVGGVPAQAFKNCHNLKTFVFEKPCNAQVVELDAIGAEAFYGCSSLTELVIPRETTSIGDQAFCRCSSLQSISFSSSIPPTLGTDVFLDVNPDFRILVPSPLVPVYKSNWPSLADNIFAQE